MIKILLFTWDIILERLILAARIRSVATFAERNGDEIGPAGGIAARP